MTFDDYEMALIDKVAVMGDIANPNDPANGILKRKSYQRIISLAVLAYTRAVIKEHKPGDGILWPSVAIKLRPETKEEMKARCDGKLPMGLIDFGKPSRWN